MEAEPIIESNIDDIQVPKTEKKLSLKYKIIIFSLSHILLFALGFGITYLILNKKIKEKQPQSLQEKNDYENGPLYDIIQVPSEKKHTHTLIYLHGLGSSPLRHAVNMTTPEYPLVPETTKVVMLVAPYVERQGSMQTSWFDIKIPCTFDKSTYNFEDILKNSKRVIDIIHKEASLLNGDYSKIFLFGYSQGACMSMYIATNLGKEIGGVVMQSGIVFPEVLTQDTYRDNHNTKFCVCHGMNDYVFNIDIHKKSIEHFIHFDNFERNYYVGVGHASWEYTKKNAKEFFFKYMK